VIGKAGAAQAVPAFLSIPKNSGRALPRARPDDVTPKGPRMALSLDTLPRPRHAADACRTPIRASAADPQHVDGADVRDAPAEALVVFGLPPDCPDSASTSWLREALRGGAS
jgi:hypothetical protein